MHAPGDYPFKAIAAMSLNRVIGSGPDIPWKISRDLQWFKKLTMGNTLVMGRLTYASIGRALPGRRTVVLSRTPRTYPDAIAVSDLASVLDLPPFGELFICGGGQIYTHALPLCQELFLTLVKRTVSGDVYFPEFENEFTLAETLEEDSEIEIRRYRRI